MDLVGHPKKNTHENIFSNQSDNCITSVIEKDVLGNINVKYYLIYDVNNDRIYMQIDKSEIGQKKYFNHKSITYSVIVSDIEYESNFLNNSNNTTDYVTLVYSKQQENEGYFMRESRYVYKNKFRYLCEKMC